MAAPISFRMSHDWAAVQALGPEAVYGGLRGVGRKVRATARVTVPVLSGALRDSIATRGNRRNMTVRVGSFGGKARHAYLVEYGTFRTNAKPYLFPAYEQHRSEAAAEVRRAARNRLRRFRRLTK